MTEKKRLKIHLLSFGFKYGAPADINFLWDARFLPNPYWEEELRPLTGLEDAVSDYVITSSEGQSFIKLLKPLLLYVVQQNIAKEEDELRLAIGCTGGRHRSVAIIEVINDLLRILPVDVSCHHRDIEKDS